MADPTLIWLAPGALSTAQPDTLAARWSGADGAVRMGDLADAAGQIIGPVRLLLSVTDVLLTEVVLNRRQARHLQRVLPWMLEDQLIGVPERFWFASGRPANGRYPVVACDKESLLRLLQVCTELSLQVVGVAVDAQLLVELSPCRLTVEGQTMILADSCQGLAVTEAEAEQVLAVLGLGELEDRSRPVMELMAVMRAAIQHGRQVELLQGDLRPVEQGSGPQLSGRWKQLIILTAACIALVALLMAGQIWRYQSAADQQLAQAVSLYNQLFPGDSAQPGYLENQFRSRLGRLGGSASGGFLGLMIPVGESLAGQQGAGLSARRIQYDERDNSLTLDVEAGSYDSLEVLRGRISEGGLQAEIANYRSQGESVTARLRVTTGS
jgi:general secretion pathway protein L